MKKKMTCSPTKVVKHRLASALLIPGILALLLAACGGGSDSSLETTTPATAPESPADAATSFALVDTGQTDCYDADGATITCPAAGQAFSGQDAQHAGNAPGYIDNGDGTVTDKVTGLMWQQSPDTDGDGDIDAADKFTFAEAVAGAAALDLGGHDNWRLPTIKELYSLIDFRGTDPDLSGTDTSGLTPFIDTGYFEFAYGDTAAGERVIDAQFVSSTAYVGTVFDGQSAVFGVNFADGRIKGYPSGVVNGGAALTFYVIYVRGNTHYGSNEFIDNGGGTITDVATGLMWMQEDSAEGMNWEEALAWAEQKNTESYLGYNDWRLPNAKELQSLVDYARSPDTTGSAAIDPIFNITTITNEAGQADFPAFWSSTTHANSSAVPGYFGVYVAFGRATGYMNGLWMDVHGAGAQRSDPKAGNPADFPIGRGPQGDVMRIFNYVRLVRTAD